MASDMETKRIVKFLEPLAKHDGVTETVLDNVTNRVKRFDCWQSDTVVSARWQRS